MNLDYYLLSIVLFLVYIYLRTSISSRFARRLEKEMAILVLLLFAMEAVEHLHWF